MLGVSRVHEVLCSISRPASEWERDAEVPPAAEGPPPVLLPAPAAAGAAPGALGVLEASVDYLREQQGGHRAGAGPDRVAHDSD